MAPSHGHGKLG